MKRSVVDIGTNSIKFCLAEGDEKGWVVVSDQCDMVCLGEGLNVTGQLSCQAMERNLASLASFVKQAQDAGAGAPLLVGTEVLRRAANGADFVKTVRDSLGLTVQILSGHQEARLSCQAALSELNLPETSLVTFDTGGGSTNFAFVEQGVMAHSQSLPLGALALTERFFSSTPVHESRLNDLRLYLAQALSAIDGSSSSSVVGIGGNVTALAAVQLGLREYDSSVVHGSTLRKNDVTTLIQRWANQTLEQRQETPGLHPRRAEVILAGGAIIEAVMTYWNVPSITVSDRSLRHALLEGLFCS